MRWLAGRPDQRVGGFSQPSRKDAGREVVVEAIGAVLFLGVAGLLAAWAPWRTGLSALTLVVLAIAYIAATNIRFPVADAWTAPTELVFVPMLFLLPAPLVPLIVAACSLVDLATSGRRRGAVTVQRLFARVADSWYAVGPAVVLTLRPVDHLAWVEWPILVVALAAQIACDGAAGFVRTWLADEADRPRVTRMFWVYASDICLACLGLLAAAATGQPPRLGLFCLCLFPAFGLLALSARDRQAMITSRRHLAEAQAAAGMGSAESDASGRHILWSGAVAELHNLPADTLPHAEAILASIADDDAAALRASRATCLASGQPFEFDYTVLSSARGPERVIRIHLSRMRQSGHPRRGMIATYQDVTDRVRRLRAEAESQAKSDLLSRVSHDLRTPLNAILGFGRLLEDEHLTVRQHERVEQIIESGNQLLELVDDVLNVTRQHVTGEITGLVPVHLDSLIAELWPVTELLASRYDVRLERDGSPGDPEVLTTSPSRLREAITNLLVNAIKYSGRGGAVRLSVDAHEPTVARIHITDNGPGISAELLPRLFVPFDRLGLEAHDHEGTGLGLPLARGLVEAMHGSLTVLSEPGVGSTFTIELQRAPQSPGPMTGLDRPSLLQHQVLLIDDSAANVGLIRAMIGADPRFGVLHAGGVEEGIRLAAWHKPALIIFGLSLRGETELKGVRDLASAPDANGVPIAVMGGELEPTLASQLGEFGIEVFLTKPLELDRVMRMLDDVANGADGRRQVLMDPVGRT